MELSPARVVLNSPRYEFRIMHELGLCFIEIPKNGSTTVKNYLFQDLPLEVSRTRYTSWIPAQPHRNLVGLTDPQIFYDNFTFAVFRDPYDRALSAFQDKGHLAIGNPRSFDDFLFSLEHFGSRQNHHFAPQVDFLPRLTTGELVALEPYDITEINNRLAADLNQHGLQFPLIKHLNRGNLTTRQLSRRHLARLDEIYNEDFLYLSYQGQR